VTVAGAEIRFLDGTTVVASTALRSVNEGVVGEVGFVETVELGVPLSLAAG
jgi:hypothetical protein